MDIDVKQIRTDFNLTIDELADVIGCSRTTIDRLQSDVSAATPRMLRSLVAFEQVAAKGHDPGTVGTAIKKRLKVDGGLAGFFELLKHVYK